MLSLLATRTLEVAEGVALANGTYKEILAEGCSGEDPPTPKLDSRQQKEERQVELGERENGLGALKEPLL